MNGKKHITYPFIPAGQTIEYVAAGNTYIQAARAFAREHSLDDTMPTGSVVVQHGVIVGRGANGSDYHQKHGCERVRLGIPTGQGYELCEGCSPKNHSEPRAIADALTHAPSVESADLYLWGHWWCCEPCWNAVQAAGIRRIYLMAGSEVLFNKTAPDNIVGKQFSLA